MLLTRLSLFAFRHANRRNAIIRLANKQSFFTHSRSGRVNIPARNGKSTVYEAMLRRVFEAAKCRTQAELAAFLGIRQSSVSDAKKRQVIPAEWLVALLRQSNTHPDWVLTGTGMRFIAPAGISEEYPSVRSAEKKRMLMQFSTQELAEELLRRVSGTSS